jgi:hypothetical protein
MPSTPTTTPPAPKRPSGLAARRANNYWILRPVAVGLLC